MRIGFIGGNGHHYLAQLVERGEAEAIAIAGDGIDNEGAKKWGENRLSGAKYYENAHELLDGESVDVVSVGAIYARNGDWVIEAVKRGLPVVSDKPIATTWDQMKAVEEAVGDAGSGAVVLTEFDLRSRPEFRAAQRAVTEGRLGKPVLATAQKSYRFGARRPDFYKQRELYGGTLMWVASHGIDLVWYVTGCDFNQVSGHQGNVAKPDYLEMEDHVAVCYGLAGGGSAIVHADFLRPAAAPTHGDDRIRVICEKGQVEVRDGICIMMTHEAGPTDITAEGGNCEVASDLRDALAGERSIFSTEKSLYMARILLESRDACDQARVIGLQSDD